MRLAKVGDQRLPVLIEQNVSRLQITMPDALFVNERERFGDIAEISDGRLQWQPAGLEQLRKRPALGERHHEVRWISFWLNFLERNDPGRGFELRETANFVLQLLPLAAGPVRKNLMATRTPARSSASHTAPNVPSPSGWIRR